MPFKLWQLFGMPDPALSAQQHAAAGSQMTPEEKDKLGQAAADLSSLTNQDQSTITEE